MSKAQNTRTQSQRQARVKAWVTSDTNEGYSVVVFAETRGKARRAGMNKLNEYSGWGVEFISVKVRRAPEFDKYAEQDKVPIQVLLDSGWWWECSRCGEQTFKDEGAVVIDDEVYCGECAPTVLAVQKGAETG